MWSGIIIIIIVRKHTICCCIINQYTNYTHDSHLQNLRQELPYAFCTSRLGRLQGLDQKNERVVDTMMVMVIMNALEKMLFWMTNTRYEYVERRQLNIFWRIVQPTTVVGQEPILRRTSWRCLYISLSLGRRRHPVFSLSTVRSEFENVLLRDWNLE